MSPFVTGALGALVVLFTFGAVRRLAWRRRFRGGRSGGGPWMLRRVFERLGTRPEQEATLSAEADALAAELRGLREDGRALRVEIADLLASPVLDAKTATARLGARLTRLDALRTRLAEGLARVHATLEPEQRTRLAALVRAGPHGARRC